MGNRSVHDPSQSPFVPWCIVDYSTDKITVNRKDFFRDLSQPMGQILPTERINHYDENYRTTATEGEENAYYYGSYFSTPSLTIHMMVRLEPYSNAALGLNNNRYDLPARVFHSLKKLFHSSTHNVRYPIYIKKDSRCPRVNSRTLLLS